jgi:hypothetical protein
LITLLLLAGLAAEPMPLVVVELVVIEQMS